VTWQGSCLLSLFNVQNGFCAWVSTVPKFGKFSIISLNGFQCHRFVLQLYLLPYGFLCLVSWSFPRVLEDCDIFTHFLKLLCVNNISLILHPSWYDFFSLILSANDSVNCGYCLIYWSFHLKYAWVFFHIFNSLAQFLTYIAHFISKTWIDFRMSFIWSLEFSLRLLIFFKSTLLPQILSLAFFLPGI
jgi:hypothetical protein